MRKKIYKCGDCGKRADLMCDEGEHHFCSECANEEDECPRCQPSYLFKI